MVDRCKHMERKIMEMDGTYLDFFYLQEDFEYRLMLLLGVSCSPVSSSEIQLKHFPAEKAQTLQKDIKDSGSDSRGHERRK